MSDKEIMDAIDDIKRSAEEQQVTFDKAMELLSDVTAERDRLKGEVTKLTAERDETKTDNMCLRESYDLVSDEKVALKSRLSAMQDVVKLAKEVRPWITLLVVKMDAKHDTPVRIGKVKRLNGELIDALAKLGGREKSYLDERLEDPEFRKHYEEQSRLVDEEEASQD